MERRKWKRALEGKEGQHVRELEMVECWWGWDENRSKCECEYNGGMENTRERKIASGVRSTSMEMKD